MGTNFHTPWQDGVTVYTADSMNAVLLTLDRIATYLKNFIVTCDGAITWASGTLTWSGDITIFYTRSDGDAFYNVISAGSIALDDNEFCFVDLAETDSATPLTMQKAAITAEAASNFLIYNRLVLGYRNPTSDKFFPVGLRMPLYQQVLDPLDGTEQEVTCADDVTIDWNDGATAFMELDRASADITLANPSNGKVYRLRLTQIAGGSEVTWSTPISWQGGAAPDLTDAAGKSDWITLAYSDGEYYGAIAKNF